MSRSFVMALLVIAIVVTAFIAGYRFANAGSGIPARSASRESEPASGLAPAKRGRAAVARTQPRPVVRESVPVTPIPVPEPDAVEALPSGDASTVSHETARQDGGLITYPPPLFVGNPGIAGLVLRDPQQRPWMITLPADAVNVALGKPVTSSDPEPLIGTLPMVTDGAKSCIEGDFLELGAGAQYVQIDLLRPARIDGVGVWHNCTTARAYYGVEVWVSNDPDFSTGVALFNNDRSNLLGRGAGTNELYLETNRGLIQMSRPLAARYVRAYSRGNTANTRNHYLEVEVYGKELE